jgi:predicted nucleotidyltransferase
MRNAKPRTQRGILALLRAQRDTLRGYGVRRIGLFGSYTKGHPKATSDIDLLVEFAEASFDNFVNVTNHLEKLLGRKVDVLTPQGIQGIRVKEVAESIKRSIVYV